MMNLLCPPELLFSDYEGLQIQGPDVVLLDSIETCCFIYEDSPLLVFFTSASVQVGGSFHLNSHMSRVKVDIADGIATITLDRPESLNAITVKDYDALGEALLEIDQRPDVVVRPSHPPETRREYSLIHLFTGNRMAGNRTLVLRVRSILFRRLALEARRVLTMVTGEPMWGRERVIPIRVISKFSKDKHAGTHMSLGRYGLLELNLEYSHLMPIQLYRHSKILIACLNGPVLGKFQG